MKHRLRDSDVWAKADASGALVTDRDGRVEIVYKPVDGQKTYRAAARNLTPVSGEAPLELTAGEPAPEKTATKTKAAPAAPPDGSIQVWTDGACSRNPGPAALGVVILDGAERRELSEYLGEGTNNIAELSAILRGLESVKDRTRPVYVYTDSDYSISVLTKNWKAKKNLELIATLKDLCRTFSNLTFVWVAGHAGIPLNERCDELANAAIARGR